MREGELRDVMRGLVAGEGQELVEEARSEAREQVKRLLVDFFTSELIDQVIAAAAPQAPNVQRLRPRPEPGSPLPTEEGHAVYVYGITGADASLELGSPGIDKQPLRAVGAGDLSALVSDVRLAEFGEEPLQRNLNDLSWLTDKVSSHQEVLSRAVASATVVPMRFCTIYRSDDAVKRMLLRHSGHISEALDALRGHDEYGVKISFQPTVVGDPEAQGGRSYLEAKQRARRELEEQRERAATVATRAHSRLQARAERSSLGRLQRDPALSSSTGELILNASYLVAKQSLSAFHAEVESLRREFPHLSIETTGPWPAYNFVTLHLEGDRGRDTG